MYLYQKSEPGLWSVGYFTPSGKWEKESDCSSAAEAAERVHWLNGGKITDDRLSKCEDTGN
jgi:hypothetical protein